MRRLLYTPIIHEEADLGRAGAPLAQQGAALSGEERWRAHRDTLSRFWDSIGAYLRSFDPRQLKLYQDGLAAEGELARRIVEEAARRGSRNYQLVLDLLKGGAEVRKTEDPALLLQEYQDTLLPLAEKPSSQGAGLAQRDRARREHLLAERDQFMAGTISATLKDGELGVLFIGANHNLLPLLAPDIRVELIKDPKRVAAYFQVLLADGNGDTLEQLREYLAAPVKVTQATQPRI